MNNNIKILLTVYTEGGVLVRKNESEEIKYELTKSDLCPYKKLKDGNKVVKRGSIPHTSLVHKQITQHLDMTEDAYNYMTSNECPYWSSMKEWKRMSKKARLEAHLKRTSEYLGGKSFNYEVLED